MTGTVLVTGGAKGIGAGVVRALVAAGHAVVFTYRSSASQAAELAQSLSVESGLSVTPVPLDLADKAAVAAFCARAPALGEIHGLVHNAGQSADSLSMMLVQDKAEAAMQVNFWSFTQLANCFVRPMMARRKGRVIAIGSVTASRANQGNAAYAATKAALEAYMRSLSLETAKRGITANTIAPGFVDTDMMEAYAAYRVKMESQIPAGRFARPEEIGALVAFLMSPQAAYITGATIPVDGGLMASMGLQR
ncbi:MAG: SDR family NAD(P)-dependent oxidoreductase [Hyphomicrobiales bacterium]|jgi:3-oxoacyl-[acyl-carrier protein] reductase|nr:SDR family NAD(P)-dependent oxidoreductase [Hyphomicrobiales bacterium]